MRIIAIDPGYDKLGIAVLEKESGARTEIVLYSDCIRTPKTSLHAARLKIVGEAFVEACEKWNPSALAIESLFFEKNKTTGIGVAEVRGVMLYEAAKRSMAITEFTPNEVKVAATGYGRSDKKQVRTLVEKLVRIEKDIREDDEMDAIAIGITWFAHKSRNSRVKM